MSAESKDARKIYTDEQTDKGEKKDKARRYAPFTLDRKKVLSALIFHPLLCFTSGTPIYKQRTSSSLSESCPKIGDLRSLRFLQRQHWCRRQAQQYFKLVEFGAGAISICVCTSARCLRRVFLTSQNIGAHL